MRWLIQVCKLGVKNVSLMFSCGLLTFWSKLWFGGTLPRGYPFFRVRVRVRVRVSVWVRVRVRFGLGLGYKQETRDDHLEMTIGYRVFTKSDQTFWSEKSRGLSEGLGLLRVLPIKFCPIVPPTCHSFYLLVSDWLSSYYGLSCIYDLISCWGHVNEIWK